MQYIKYFINHSNVFFYYVKELKYKFMYSLLSILMTIITCYIYINQLIYVFSSTLLHYMNSHRFIFTQLTEVFFTYFKFSIIIGILISIPFILINFWLFLLPGLYKYEKLYLNIYICIILLLFIISIIVNYYFIFPNILKFFLYYENNNLFFPIHFEAKINQFIFPILLLLFNITLCFQIPSIFILLLFFKIIEFKYLIKKRKYFYIFFIMLSALIAPPDIYSQIILTLIIIGVYEIFLFILFFFNRFFFYR